MAYTKTFLNFIFKKMKKARNMRQIRFLCPWTRKRFPLITNSILEMSWFVHISLQNKHIVPIVYALLRSYLDRALVALPETLCVPQTNTMHN